MFQSRNVETEVNHQKSGSYRYLTHTTGKKAMMEEKDKIRQSTKFSIAEYETDGSMKFITGEDLRTLVS